MTSANDVRELFLNYFARHDHEIVPSAPIVPQNDPSLLFVNAGMVPFKEVFLGKEQRDYTRATSSQKCVRAGGKHNDLENVGYTTRHHTFFEMLGNFSFGDYFKQEAIELAWNFVADELGLDPNRLIVTVYAKDAEAYQLWQDIAGLPEDKIIKIDSDDNFWAMGDTGPCGPCTEIFYDNGPEVSGGPPGSAAADGDRFVEIWNNVFMQYDRGADGQLTELPNQSIDTGMGLERITAVLQGTHDNFETDLFQDLIQANVNLTGQPDDETHSTSHRVVADHLRASAFLMADGVLPSNDGRGYVLRRIMRRAMRHMHLLGMREAGMHQLVPVLTDQMGDAYPELHRAQSMIQSNLKREEEKFRQTLDRGLGLLEEAMSKLPSGGELPGQTAFKLYDTYGFPLDLTQDILRGADMTVDLDGFETAMEKQREQARAAWTGSGDQASDKLWYEIRDEIGATDFVGYTDASTTTSITAIVKDGEKAEKLEKGESGILILAKTPFYAESGGQVGDTGFITADDMCFKVHDTKKQADGLYLHIGECVEGRAVKGSAVTAKIDGDRRHPIRHHHSATHLLHRALQDTLGDHVAQKGSYVGPNRLRFDISHPDQITADELDIIERAVNDRIRQNTPVTTDIMPVDQAMEAGATALFGEKYGDEVRVVSMGGTDDHDNIYSMELCGGTHVGRTGDIGVFKIISEGSVSSGVRRVEALAGKAAFDYLAHRDQLVDHLSDQMNALPDELPDQLAMLRDDYNTLEQTVADLRRQLALTGGGGADTGQRIEQIDGAQFLAKVVEGLPPGDLRPMADELIKKLDQGIVVVITTTEGKASIVVAVTKNFTDRVNAVDLVRLGAEALGGSGGGGRPDMAQSGGSDPGMADQAVGIIRDRIATQMKEEELSSTG
jgi:alanyl-tRNA synthetase